MNNKYFLGSFFWSFTSKILDAGIKFFTLPLLLTYFGKAEFGLIALATSVNAYLQLLDMGVNTGAIRYFSEWIVQKKFDLIDSTARTSISFYTVIGLLNALVLLSVAFFGMSIFSIDKQQSNVLKILFIILAFFALINWSTSVFNQLLTANRQIQFVQKISILKSIATLGLVFITTWLKLGIVEYFFLFSLVNSLILIPYFFKCKSEGLVKSIFPNNDWKNFGVIFKYSAAILAMAVFQLSATKLRPVILGIYSQNATDVLTDYRVLETITQFVISIGGMMISIFLPITSSLISENNKEKINRFAETSTKTTTIICLILSMPFIIGGKEIIILYVGSQYVDLYKWLVIWMVTILFFLHNSPVASLVLSTGKTKALVLSSAISCVVSLIVNISLCRVYEVGSAVLGYGCYIVMQMAFYYFYFNTRVLEIRSLKVFKSFIIPTFLAFVSFYGIFYFRNFVENTLIDIFLRCAVWFFAFVGLLLATKTVDYNVVRDKFDEILKKRRLKA